MINTVGGDVTDIVPPCDAMMARTLESPRPVPWCFVVKRGSNIFCIFSSAMPSPESSNSKIRWFVLFMTRMTMLPSPSPMASTEFDKILLNATDNRILSAIKGKSFSGNVTTIFFVLSCDKIGVTCPYDPGNKEIIF